MLMSTTKHVSETQKQNYNIYVSIGHRQSQKNKI